MDTLVYKRESGTEVLALSSFAIIFYAIALYTTSYIKNTNLSKNKLMLDMWGKRGVV